MFSTHSRPAISVHAELIALGYVMGLFLTAFSF